MLLEAVWSLSTQEEAAGRAARGPRRGPGGGPPGGGVPPPQRGEPRPAHRPRGARTAAEEPLRHRRKRPELLVTFRPPPSDLSPPRVTGADSRRREGGGSGGERELNEGLIWCCFDAAATAGDSANCRVAQCLFRSESAVEITEVLVWLCECVMGTPGHFSQGAFWLLDLLRERSWPLCGA